MSDLGPWNDYEITFPAGIRKKGEKPIDVQPTIIKAEAHEAIKSSAE